MKVVQSWSYILIFPLRKFAFISIRKLLVSGVLQLKCQFILQRYFIYFPCDPHACVDINRALPLWRLKGSQHLVIIQSYIHISIFALDYISRNHSVLLLIRICKQRIPLRIPRLFLSTHIMLADPILNILLFIR